MFTVIHALVGHFYLLLTVRVLSRRPGAQLTPFEFVLVFLIGGVVILTTVGDDRSETNSVCAVLTVALVHRTISTLKERYPKVAAIVDGIPLVVLENGQWHSDLIEMMRLDKVDVMAAPRTEGVKDLTGIKYAILERNGSIRIIKAE